MMPPGGSAGWLAGWWGWLVGVADWLVRLAVQADGWVLTSQPGGFVVLFFCASATTARISGSDYRAGQGRAGRQGRQAGLRSGGMWPGRAAPSG
jgi:hypothetical protein